MKPAKRQGHRQANLWIHELRGKSIEDVKKVRLLLWVFVGLGWVSKGLLDRRRGIGNLTSFPDDCAGGQLVRLETAGF